MLKAEASILHEDNRDVFLISESDVDVYEQDQLLDSDHDSDDEDNADILS